ncbi:hypothetical protein SAMD00019534_097700 [Acytostelium subglobosum LB1]|uniref:hypothetical protein n=1 Tax=Acytostelium subglobosum LB1 TaxID=1410327 RepID=UPI000644CD9A|nr:hypothetical protein SAMD00019534_097700 [Acytostelium subglobosum LB1]GAM26595.1 hypothetical protein SAMD00019534_097700 [Acytostelium subglobosum LB1]|eukprot:XP_012750256.1 hypothetical protein SAMD00019534_097700 [Acytostelium subglobosum LB1]
MKLFVLLNIIAIIGLVSSSTISTTTLDIADGPLEGLQYDTYRAFLGVQFIQPPIGSLRWKSPVAPTPWSPSVYNATYERPGCPQVCEMPNATCPSVTSEDCLYLNVYTPLVTDNTELLPVMVFFPGGRFSMGAASTPLYDGGSFVNRSNVILVTTNYRLGVLGFLATDTIAGNFGFEDQLMSLQWVQANIKSFGGDPTRVTVFGESAGGTSSSIHLTSPASAGLFSNLIIESNPWALPVKTAKQMYPLAEKFAKDLGCKVTDDACMMAKTVDEITIAQNTSENSFSVLHPLFAFLPWTPIVDGKLILDQPLAMLEKGNFNKVPVLMGTVQEEALIFIASVSTNINSLEYHAALVDIFGRYSIGIDELYKPLVNGSNYEGLMTTIGTDYIFVCPTRRAAVAVAQAGLPVFQYQFIHVSSFDAYGPAYPMCVDAVCHGMELPYVFNTVTATGQFTFTPAEQQLSYDMMAYWSNFAKTSNPNVNTGSGFTPAQPWTMYSAQGDSTLIFQTPTTQTTGLRAHYCDYFDTIGYEIW